MNIAILPAAGMGTRLGLGLPKALVALPSEQTNCKYKTSIVELTAFTFAQSKVIDGIIILATPDHIEEFRELNFPPNTHILPGGETRKESVGIGVRALDTLFPDAEIILIHDAARCFLSTDLIKRCVSATKKYSAITCALKITDTIAKADENNEIADYIPREDLWAIQTPQCFKKELIQSAHQLDFPQATDDTTLVAKLCPVKIIEGEKNNIKITYQEDLKMLSQKLMDSNSVFENQM